MNMTKLKVLGGSCAYFLFIAFSASVHAADVNRVDSGVSIEGWSVEGGRDIPILSFDEIESVEEFSDDIRAEGFVQDKDGSVRFQLSHSGPLSRQVFANVRRVEQDNGLTRSIITNIADGDQMEYLTATTPAVQGGKHDKAGEGDLLTQLADMEDMNTECPLCPFIIGALAAEVICAATATWGYRNCRVTCAPLGGVKSYDTGICGHAGAECVCWIAPRRTADERLDG